MGSTFLSSRHRELTRLRRRRRAKTQWVFMSKTTTLHGHQAFLYISLPPLHNYDVKCPILSWLENGNGKTINLTVSLWTRVHGSPLFSSKLNSLLLSNWVTWYEGTQKKNWKDAVREVYFSATLSLASPLSDLFWPVFICFVHAASGEFTDGWKLSVIGPFTRNCSIVSLCSHETDERGYS